MELPRVIPLDVKPWSNDEPPQPPPPKPEDCLRCYVGHIHPRISDEFLTSLLEKCGEVNKWTRDKDPSSQQLASFGFAEFGGPEGVFKALAFLNGRQMHGTPLLLRVQDKVKEAAERWHRQQRELISQSCGDEDPEIAFQKSLAPLQESIEKEVGNLPVIDVQSEDITQSVNTSHGRASSKNSGSMDNKSSVRDTEGGRSKADYPVGVSKGYHKHKRERARQSRVSDREAQAMRKYRRLLIDWKDYEDLRETQWQRQLGLPEEEKEDLIVQELEGEIIQSRKTREEQRSRRQLEREADAAERENENSEKLAKKRTYTIARESTPPPKPMPKMGETIPPKENVSAAKTITMNMQMASVFGDDEEGPFTREHKPLTKLEQSRDLTNRKNEAVEKRRILEMSRALLSQIPANKEELFAHPIDWELIDEQQIVDRKLKPWVHKKIIEYMGAEEDLVGEVIGYVIGRIKQRPKAGDLLSEVVRFLDEVGESFVKNIWRMLIFEEMKFRRANV